MAFFNIPLIDPVARTTKRKETEKRATGMRERGTRRTQILKDTLKGLVPEREPIDRSQIPSSFPGLGQPGAMSMGGTQFPTLPTLPGVQSRGQSIQDIFGNIQPGGQSLLPQGSGGAFPLPAVNVQPSQAQTLPIVGNQPATSPVPLGGAQAQVAQPFTTPSAEAVNGEVINTGNPQLDSLLNSLPQIQEALGIGVETEAQRTQREGQEQSLNRLISLQEQLIQAQAPDDTIADLDRTIQQQMKALEETTPERLLATQPTLGEEGITQGQLLRESASRRDPIARTLSDLLSSRSILADTQQRKQQSLQNKFTGLQNIASLQEALGALQPETGIAPGVQSGILQGIVGQAFEDPLDRELQQAQIDNIKSQIAERGGGATGVRALLEIPGVVPAEQERAVLSGIISSLPDAKAREGAASAVATFKNAETLIDLLDADVSTGLLSTLIKGTGRIFGITGQVSEDFKAASTIFTANFIKALSGVQVSDKERKFLEGALPTEGKQEKSNRAGIKQILKFLKNRYELQLGFDFEKFPNEIPEPFEGGGREDTELSDIDFTF